MPSPNFDVRHRDWSRMALRWRMAEAFNLGGIAVMEPDYAVGKIRYASLVSTTNPTAINATTAAGGQKASQPRAASDFTWRTAQTKSFLWKHEGESIEDYEERCSRLFNFPLFQAVINIFVAGVLRQQPLRPDVGNWQAFHEDVDLLGTNIDAFIRQALAGGLNYGRMHAITDRPSAAGPALSLEDETARGERGYACLFSPLDLVDWKLDERGQFDWLVRREDAPDERKPGDLQAKLTDQYRVWTREEWILYRKQEKENKTESGGWVVAGRGTHALASQRRVPVATLWTTRDAHRMSCESPLADILDINRDILNKLSELDETERTQTFAILAVPGRDGAAPGGIDLSPFRYMTYDAEQGAPVYVSPDSSLPTGKWQRIQDKLFVARQLAGVSRGRAEFSKEERSAEAITVESEDKRNQMAAWAGATEEFDREIHRQVAAWDNVAVWSRASYRRDFDFKGVAVQINELTQLRTTEAVDGQTMAKLARSIVEKIATEQGLPPEDLAKMLEAFDKESKPPPEEATATNKLLETVGGIQALVQLVQSAQAGSMSRESAIAMLVIVLGIDEPTAAKIVGEKLKESNAAMVPATSQPPGFPPRPGQQGKPTGTPASPPPSSPPPSGKRAS